MAMSQENDNSIVYLGKTNFRGQEKIFGIQSHNEDRFQHMYVIGQTGTGKSTLLKNIAIQDIHSGRGIAVIDPHGEFVEDLLTMVPEDRVKDVIYFNPADIDFPIGFNVLEVNDPGQKHLVASGLMSIFTKIWAGVWSARMEYILNNAVLALLDSPDTTFLGITRMLVDKNYRKYIVDNIKDPLVKSFWVNEYEQYNERLRTDAISPIQNKVGQFLASPLIRNMVGQTKSTLRLDDAMNTGKILLANVSKGRVGEDNSALLGAMLITKIQLTAMERVKIVDISQRKPFILFVDEFQNFATDSFASILSEARKYRLGLIISHQFIGQLVTDTSTKVRDAIFGNVGTMVNFRVGAPDAEFLEKLYAPALVMEDLVNLPNRQIYIKLMINGLSSRAFSASTLPPITTNQSEETKEKVIEFSRHHYGKSREDVENAINEWSTKVFSTGTSEEKPAPRRNPYAQGGSYQGGGGGGYQGNNPRPQYQQNNNYPPQNNNYSQQAPQNTPWREDRRNNDERRQDDRRGNNQGYQGYQGGQSNSQSSYQPRPPQQRQDSYQSNNSRGISLEELSKNEPQPFKKSKPTTASTTEKQMRREVDTDSLRALLQQATYSETLEPQAQLTSTPSYDEEDNLYPSEE